MAETAIVVRRHADSEEEPDLICIEIIATNGTFAFRTDQFYCGRRLLEQFGAALSKFPANVLDRPEFSRGVENAEDQSSFISIAAFVSGARTALRFRFKDRSHTEAFDGFSEFSIPVETAAINRLGALVQDFSGLGYSDLHWTPNSGELFAEPQSIG